MKLQRVLIVAENASTRLGGEAILPFHYFRLLRERGIDAHLVVHDRMRPELEAAFAADLAHVHFVRDKLLQKLFYQAGRILPRRIDEATLGLANQFLTQLGQRAVVRKLIQENTVVHQPIPVSPRFPSLMDGFKAPVVIGPLNGGMEWPPAFRASEAAWSRLAIQLGRSLTNLFNAILPGKRRAAVILVANQRTAAALPSGLQGRVVELIENGVDAAQWTAGSPSDGKKRFVFVGRLVDWKALDIAIDAISRIPEASLDIVGSGPMQTAWTAHASQAGATVRFHGFKSQVEAGAILAGSCGLVLPSLYECGGAVVLEAMALGLPVIATAWGGPLDYLDPTCGFLIPPETREQLVAGFAGAMLALTSDPALRDRMGAAGRARVMEHFEWNRKVDRILQIYESTLA